jgi:iron complex transport system permease protein
MSTTPLSDSAIDAADGDVKVRRSEPAMRAMRIGLALAGAAVASVLLAISLGSSHIPIAEVISVLVRPGDSAASEVVHQLRLPRALAAFATGGLLAYSGALMQVLLRNPLADPYVLGLSGGSAVGALGAMLLGLGSLFIDVGAFVGALTTVALVFALARHDMARTGSTGSVNGAQRLVLTGVMLASAWSAVVTVILIVSPESKLRGMLFWLMGDLGGAESYISALCALPVLLLLMFPAGRDLNALLHGPDIAYSLGVRVASVRRLILVASSLAAAIAVTTAGTIGFVGLVVPHGVRLVIGNDQRFLLPACAVAGGTLLVLADTAARTMFAPEQLPVGVVMAIIGVPVFMLLLVRRTGQP